MYTGCASAVAEASSRAQTVRTKVAMREMAIMFCFRRILGNEVSDVLAAGECEPGWEGAGNAPAAAVFMGYMRVIIK